MGFAQGVYYGRLTLKGLLSRRVSPTHFTRIEGGKSLPSGGISREFTYGVRLHYGEATPRLMGF